MALGDPVEKRIERLKQAVMSASSPDALMAAVTREALHYQYDRVCNWLVNSFQRKIQFGPFAGMQYIPTSVGSLYPPKLIGCYEAELHPVIRRIVVNKYQRILNVGAAEGYYAVGLARLLPDATVYAFDMDPQAAPLGRKLAAENGVAKRVIYLTKCLHETFERLATPGALILCDIEGGELELLDPARAPSLARTDLLVECHDFLPTPTSKTLAERFRPTHEVVVIPNGGINPNAIPFLRGRIPIQKLFAVWEGRPGPTPWLWMTARNRQP